MSSFRDAHLFWLHTTRGNHIHLGGAYKPENQKKLLPKFILEPYVNFYWLHQSVNMYVASGYVCSGILYS